MAGVNRTLVEETGLYDPIVVHGFQVSAFSTNLGHAALIDAGNSQQPLRSNRELREGRRVTVETGTGQVPGTYRVQ